MWTFKTPFSYHNTSISPISRANRADSSDIDSLIVSIPLPFERQIQIICPTATWILTPDEPWNTDKHYKPGPHSSLLETIQLGTPFTKWQQQKRLLGRRNPPILKTWRAVRA